MRTELLGLHQRMRTIIEEIAQRIEDAKFRDAETALEGMGMGYNEARRAASLVRADKQIHTSYQALRITVEFFSGLNQMVLARVEQETAPGRQSDMMLGNAILIFELTEFVIRYIETFAVRGADHVESLHADAKRRIAGLHAQQEKLAEQARQPDIIESTRQQTLVDIENRRSAIDELDREWDNYLGEIEGLDSSVDQIRAKLPTLRLIQENARVQIGLLQLVALLRFLRQSSDTIQGTVDALQGFQLAPLSSARVRRLLGL